MNAANDTHSKTIGYILWIFGFTARTEPDPVKLRTSR